MRKIPPSSTLICVALCLPLTAGGAPRHPEAGAGAAEEAERGDAGEGHAEERAQQGSAGSQQAGESVQGAAETQPLAQGTATDGGGGATRAPQSAALAIHVFSHVSSCTQNDGQKNEY